MKGDTCPCLLDPYGSACGEWEGNTSACACVELGLEGRLPP